VDGVAFLQAPFRILPRLVAVSVNDPSLALKETRTVRCDFVVRHLTVLIVSAGFAGLYFRSTRIGSELSPMLPD